jgi:O-palmitoleoyl transferase
MTNDLIKRRAPKKNIIMQVSSSMKRKSAHRSYSATATTFPAASFPTMKSSASSSIVKPMHIELPHSLVDVVVNWNLPMHFWLKLYVYVPMKQQYGHFASVLLTYFASALLHGLNFQLSIVLFSIGLYAYVEYGFRRKLACIINACVAARTCPSRSSCEHHTYTYWHPLTMMVNCCLCLLSLWHLTYLGQLFDGSSQETIGYSWQHVLDKWAKLNFASHLVVIGTYVLFRSL